MIFRTFLVLILLFVKQSLQQNPAISCQGDHKIEKTANLKQEYWYPSNFGNDTPILSSNQQCFFDIVVPVGFYAQVAISVQIPDDADFQIVDYLNLSESHKNISSVYFFIQPGAKLYLTLKNTQGRFGFGVRWFAMPQKFLPENATISKSSSNPVLYGGNLIYPNVFTADTRVSLVAFNPYYDQYIDYMRSIVVFDGPDWNSPCLGNLYNIYMSNKQCVSTGNQMTTFTLNPGSSAGYSLYMVQDYSNTKDIVNYQGSLCLSSEVCVRRISATNGPAAISTYRNFEYLESASINDGKLDVYINGILSDKSNLIASYNSTTVGTNLPQEFLGTVRTYVLSQGSATLIFAANADFFSKGFYGRKGFIASRFYKTNDHSTNQDSTDWISGNSFGSSLVFNYKINIRSADLPANSTLSIIIENGSKGRIEKIFNNSTLPTLNQEITGIGYDMTVTYRTYSNPSKGFYLDFELEKSAIDKSVIIVYIMSLICFVFCSE